MYNNIITQCLSLKHFYYSCSFAPPSLLNTALVEHNLPKGLGSSVVSCTATFSSSEFYKTERKNLLKCCVCRAASSNRIATQNVVCQGYIVCKREVQLSKACLHKNQTNFKLNNQLQSLALVYIDFDWIFCSIL